MSKLFSPITIKSVTLKNRITVSPMCTYSATDGYATNWHLVHLGTRATGGAGLIIQEATAVSPEGRISPGDLGLYLDQHVDKLKEITAFIHEQGSVAGIQLAHAGRKAGCAKPWDGGLQLSPENGGWTTVAPSAIAFNTSDNLPSEMDITAIEKVISDFKSAAYRALQAGYKVVEIHAAHGYLIHQFLSPLSNLRSDNYGGSFENRIRLLLQVTEAIQQVWPQNLPLFVRISATDWVQNGWDISEAVQLAFLLKNKGVDLIDCSSGGMVPYAKIPAGPGFQLPFSERIKTETGILTGTVGFITTATQAEEILQHNKADLIFMGRELLRNPYFPLMAAKALNEQIAWPRHYLRAQ